MPLRGYAAFQSGPLKCQDTPVCVRTHSGMEQQSDHNRVTERSCGIWEHGHSDTLVFIGVCAIWSESERVRRPFSNAVETGCSFGATASRPPNFSNACTCKSFHPLFIVPVPCTCLCCSGHGAAVDHWSSAPFGPESGNHWAGSHLFLTPWCSVGEVPSGVNLNRLSRGTAITNPCLGSGRIRR